MFNFCNKETDGLGKLKNLSIHEQKEKLYFPRYIDKLLPNDKLSKFIDKKFKPSKIRKFKFTGELREAQSSMFNDVKEIYDRTGNIYGIVQARPGTGKCHAKNQPILMHNGTIKLVQYIVKGDKLMGPDSKPRTVLSTTVGHGKLFRITLDNNDYFTCNENHILCLKNNRNKIINISLEEYLKKDDDFKKKHKMWKTCVDFNDNRVSLNPTKIAHYFSRKYIDNVYNGDCEDNIIKDSTIRSYLYYHRLRYNEIIPFQYKYNSHKVRYEFIRGIIEYLKDQDENGYIIKSKDIFFIDEVKFICESVGFWTKKEYNSDGQVELTINGDFGKLNLLTDIDCKKKDLYFDFTIEYLEEDAYYGFTLDQDNLYLLDNFTVTHNTVFSIYLSHFLQKKTLVVVYKEQLIDQWKEEFKKYTTLKDKDFGLIKGKIFDVDKKRIIFTTPQTLASKVKKDVNEIYEKIRDLGIDYVVWDEAHIFDIAWASSTLLFNTKNFIGLSATPWHSGDKDILMKSTFGPVVTEFGEYDYQPTVKFLHYNSGLGDKYGRRVCWLWENRFMQGRSAYNKALVNSASWINNFLDIVELENKDENNCIIAIFMTIEQLDFAYDNAVKRGLKPTKLYSKQRKLNKEEDNLVFAIFKYASDAFDYKKLNRLILPVPIMGKKALVQTIGRIARESENKEDIIVWDMIDTDPGFRGLLKKTKYIKIKVLEQEFEEVVFEDVDKLN